MGQFHLLKKPVRYNVGVKLNLSMNDYGGYFLRYLINKLIYYSVN